MIKRIFWDIDSTLIYTTFSDPEQDHIKFYLDDCSPYYTIIRPSARKLVEYSRNLVGKDNVYILTSATKDYASVINQMGCLGFEEDHIFAREDTDKNLYRLAYDGVGCYPNKDVADKDNVLIDDLPFHYNTNKMNYIGIKNDRYLQIREYFGVNNHEEEFIKQVIEFLEKKNDE